MTTKKNENPPVYKRFTDVCVDMYTRDNSIEMRTLNGRLFFNSAKGEILFIQNTPRGPRSKEVGRTVHSRYVRRPDGDYTVTFHFSAYEQRLQQKLLEEVKVLVSVILADSGVSEDEDDEAEWR
ncbi:MAG: hypothetical protein K6E93_02400 [Bacteroidales bacterium]|nr:hypothetical protein [Bacteroidales bacterium]